MMNERIPGFCGICGFSPDSTLGTEITKSRPKSRRALPEIVLATSPTRSRMVSWLKSFSCIFISSTVSMALEAVKYTTPSRLPEMLMTPVYSCTAGEPSIRAGEPIEAGCCAATSKKFVVPSTKVLSSCSCSMTDASRLALAHEIRDGFVQLPVGEGLVEEAIRAALHRLHRRRLVCQRRDHQDPHRGLQGDELTDALDAVHARHGEIHGLHVRIGLLEQLDGLEPVGGRAHQLQVLELLRTFDAPAHDVRVVDDHQLEGSFSVAVHRCCVAVAHERRLQRLRRPRC